MRKDHSLKKVFISCHQGLGDHLLCNGIYREYAKLYKKCVLPVETKYIDTIRYMLSDVNNIQIIPLPLRKSWKYIRIWRLLYTLLGYRHLKLGSHGANFFLEGVRFDKNFYDQAKIPFTKRWSSFAFPRNYASESSLFDSKNAQKGQYVFLHEDASRNYLIDRSLIQTDLPVITPSNLRQNINFFHYALLLENAAEIHCIESSFAAFVESMQVPVKKFAHRYARGHAAKDFRHEFTYLSDWIIYD